MKMKGVQGCADHNYHESDRISLRTYSEAFPTGQKTVDFFSDQHGPRPLQCAGCVVDLIFIFTGGGIGDADSCIDSSLTDIDGRDVSKVC